MSVAVIQVQPNYMESFLQRPLSALPSHDSDSDAGYGTPAETFFAVEELKKEKKSSAAELSSSDEEERGELVVDSELQEKIIRQVEWYFSDENLQKDSFLMKHINRNKQGYVSLKLVASLRKVKTLSKDWKVVLESLKHSSLLALNEEETKIRRKSPAPQVDFGHIAKTLLITEYPQEQPNLADLEQHFGRYGEVSRVRLIHPGRAIPLDVKPCKAQHPFLGKDLCVLVEYGTEQAAKTALSKIRKQQSWRDEMKVYKLGEKNAHEVKEHESHEGKRKAKGKESKAPETQSQSQRQKGNPHHKENAPQRLRDLSRFSREVSPIPYKPSSPPSSSSPSPDAYRRRNKNSPGFSRKYLRPDTCKDYSSDSGMSCGSRSSSESPKITPEPPRKFFSSGFDKHHSHHMNSCVIRQPLGPDGTRGFAARRPSPISIAVQSC